LRAERGCDNHHPPARTLRRQFIARGAARIGLDVSTAGTKRAARNVLASHLSSADEQLVAAAAREVIKSSAASAEEMLRMAA